MNERIKKLILQAGFIEDDGGNDFHVFDGYESITCTEELKKFAELIVRECATVCRGQPNVYAMKVDRDNCAIAIEEHFGVE